MNEKFIVDGELMEDCIALKRLVGLDIVPAQLSAIPYCEAEFHKHIIEEEDSIVALYGRLSECCNGQNMAAITSSLLLLLRATSMSLPEADRPTLILSMARALARPMDEAEYGKVNSVN